MFLGETVSLQNCPCFVNYISSIQAKLYDQTYRVDCYSQSKPLWLIQ